MFYAGPILVSNFEQDLQSTDDLTMGYGFGIHYFYPYCSDLVPSMYTNSTIFSVSVIQYRCLICIGSGSTRGISFRSYNSIPMK